MCENSMRENRRKEQEMKKQKRRVESGNEIVRVLMMRDGYTRSQAEAELLRVREEFSPLEDDPEEVLAYEFGLEPDYIFDLLG